MENLSKKLEEETLLEQYRKELVVKIEKLQKNKAVIFDDKGTIVSKYKTAYINLKKEIYAVLLRYCTETLFSIYCIPNNPKGLTVAAKMKSVFLVEYASVKEIAISTCDISKIDEELQMIHQKLVEVWWEGLYTPTVNAAS